MIYVEISETLRDAVQARMDDLEMSPSDFSAATGLSGTALQNLRKGEVRRYQKRLTGPVCRVFGWTPDSIDRLLRGEQPVEVVADVSQSNGSADSVLARAALVETMKEVDRRLAHLERELGAVQDRLDAISGLSHSTGA